MKMEVAWWMWAIVLAIMVITITVDLLLHRERNLHVTPFKESIIWVSVCVFLSVLFSGCLWLYYSYYVNDHIANEKVLEYFSGYLIEQSLSIDNMFVFYSIFNQLSLSLPLQRKVLTIGIISAIIMRLIFILFGLWFINKTHWALYVFGIFLLILGVKILTEDKNNSHKSLIFDYLTSKFKNSKFSLDKLKRLNHEFHLPSFLFVIFIIEIVDLIFAIDSIPAIFAITQDPFIVFSSNIFAILCLRSLYFVLAHMAEQFYYLKYGIGCLLIFIGSKMLMSYWFKPPVSLTLIIVFMIILISLIMSIFKNKSIKKIHSDNSIYK